VGRDLVVGEALEGGGTANEASIAELAHTDFTVRLHFGTAEDMNISPMTKRIVAGAFPLLWMCLHFGILQAQAPAGAPAAKADYSQEPYIIEKMATKVSFANDGTGTTQQTASIRVQSDSGVQRWGLLTFPYRAAEQTIEIEDVRVIKADGRTVATPEDNVQDLDSEITRAAPLYSDQREKHVAVKSLAIGDTVEFQVLWHTTKPLAPGQFWYEYDFARDSIALDQRLEISVPESRTVVVKGPVAPQNIAENSGVRTYAWSRANLEDAPSKKIRAQVVDTALGHLREPDVILSSYQNWQEVGRWYWDLQKERVEPSADVRAKAVELTKDKTDTLAKIQAIYTFVSEKYRYIGIDFGIGRYQPHSADDILSNNFGDCKDKHTLLAALLQAVGIPAYPALISFRRNTDPDAPTPAQFDHVITYVPQGKDALWLDSTAELSPMGFLTMPLRGKQALVMTGEDAARLITTPEELPLQGTEKFEVNGTLSDDGSLEAKIDVTAHNDDSELVLRTAFRKVGEPQWQVLVQGFSQRVGFAGTVSDVDAGSPEQTDQPFHFSYSYRRKDFPDWPNHRINMPSFPFVLPSAQDVDLDSDGRVFLGPKVETDSDATVQLPKGYAADLPPNVDWVRDYAEYHAAYSSGPQSVSVRRSYVVKLREVPAAEQQDYAKFLQQVRNDVGRYVMVRSTAGLPPKQIMNLNLNLNLLPAGQTFRDDGANLPDSPMKDASQLENDAMKAIGQDDMFKAFTSLTAAVKADPRFARAWLRLATVQTLIHQSDDAIASYHKAIEADPTQAISYKSLASYLMSVNRTDDAIAVWQQLLKVDANNREALATLGRIYLKKKRYGEAIAPLEAVVKVTPDAIGPVSRLAEAYLLAGDLDKGHAEVAEARKLRSPEVTLNDISFGLADENRDLPDALAYAQEAVRIEEDASGRIRLEEMTSQDLKHPEKLANFWDTLGWVYFRMGHQAEAEEYLRSAWTASQYGVIGDHLAQVYDHEMKKQEAILMYRLALKTLEGRIPVDRQEEIGMRLQELAPGQPTGAVLGSPGGVSLTEQLTKQRTVRLPKIVDSTASAEFFVAIGAGPKIEEVKFVDGADELRPAEKFLSAATYPLEFPSGSSARIVRRGLLDCRPSSGCEFVLLPIDSVTSVN
jgi:tetratricopeptide (TPR) repeat protein